ncbi:MAG TPA: histidine kinase, partial [Xylanibacter oryzae]|nr:histidine kinase [Xylanibacter oryzae]
NKITSTNKQEADELMMLVKLIRANLDISRNTYISLKDELDFVKYYINIEKYILGDDFEFILKVPDNLIISEITIPSMFIQILAENAIKHGLKCKEGKKILEINVSNNTNGTDIIVKDNGIGFDIRRSNNSSTKTGLDIITRTFAICNKSIKYDKYRFDIHNIIDEHGKIAGCENVLHIPNIKQRK